MQATFLSTETFAQYEDSDREECRICLQELEGRPAPFCECRGNHRSVHEACLREWALRAEKFRDGRGHLYFYCDLCRTPIFMAIERTCRKKTAKEACREVRQNYCKLALMLVIIIFFAGLLVVALAAMLDHPELMGAYLTLAVISGIMVSFSLPLLVCRMAFECREAVGGFVPIGSIIGNHIANSYNTNEA